MRKDREYTEPVEETVVEKPKKDKNKVTVNVPNLTVRRGPGKSNVQMMVKLSKDTVVDIDNVFPGEGAKKGWGHLKSVDGWINLDFTDYEE